MGVIKSNRDYATNIIYNAAVDEEKEWRKNGHIHDIAIVDQLLGEVRELGYHYKYFVDITNRDNDDKNLLKLLLGYIGRFQDDYYSAALVAVVGKKGNTSATEIILKSYMGLSEESKRKHAGFYDNALNQIKDKRYVSSYMELLKKPEDAIKLPLTMIMLAKWQLEDAKQYFLDYLNANILYHNQTISDLIYISLEALSYYQDAEGFILKALEDKLNADDKDLLSATQKAIQRVKKRKIDKV